MSDTDWSIAALALQTQDVYERQGARFDAERPKDLHERVWLDRFTGLIPKRGRILDLGCGAAEPIAAHFIASGFEVVGFDLSSSMLALARERFPKGDWREGDMRALDLPERFDGILGWNSFFHLTQTEQRALLPRLAGHLVHGGALMLTVGPRAGEVEGLVGGEAVYHASLAPDEYRSILSDVGVSIAEFVLEDPSCDLQTVLLAQKACR